VPEDIDEREYYGHHHLYGKDTVELEGLSAFYVYGVKIEVKAIQDKKLYCLGDVMDFTFIIKNTGSMVDIPLKAVVSYNLYLEEQDFVLSDVPVELHFQVPIESFGVPRISYSVEFLSGRAIYINTQ